MVVVMMLIVIIFRLIRMIRMIMMTMTTVMVVRGYDDDDDDDDDEDDDVSPHVGTPGFPIFGFRVPMVFTGHGSDGCGALVPANLVFSSSGPTVTASPGTDPNSSKGNGRTYPPRT